MIIGNAPPESSSSMTRCCCCWRCYKRSRRVKKEKKNKKKAWDLDDPVPKIEVVGSSDLHSPPAYTEGYGYTKHPFEKKAEEKGRPLSADENTLVADSSSRKDRWSYASSSASSRSDLSDSVEDHSSKKTPDQQT